MEKYNNVIFHQDSIFKSDQVLDALSEQDNISIVKIPHHRHYLSGAMGFIIKVWVKIAKVSLIPTFYLGELFG